MIEQLMKRYQKWIFKPTALYTYNLHWVIRERNSKQQYEIDYWAWVEYENSRYAEHALSDFVGDFA